MSRSLVVKSAIGGLAVGVGVACLALNVNLGAPALALCTSVVTLAVGGLVTMACWLIAAKPEIAPGAADGPATKVLEQAALLEKCRLALLGVDIEGGVRPALYAQCCEALIAVESHQRSELKAAHAG